MIDVKETLGSAEERMEMGVMYLEEDLEKDAEGDLQKIHDKMIKRVEELLAAKEKEIMTV